MKKILDYTIKQISQIFILWDILPCFLSSIYLFVFFIFLQDIFKGGGPIKDLSKLFPFC